MGERRPPQRGALLPEAGRGHPVHAGHGPAPAVEPGLPDADAAAVTAAMLRAIRQLADDEGASSVHFLFCTEAEKDALAAAEYLPRLVDAVSLAQPRRAPVRELRRLPGDVPLAQPQAGAQGTADGGGARADVSDRDGRRAGRARLGGAARVLPSPTSRATAASPTSTNASSSWRARRWRTGWSRRSPTAATNRSPAPSTSRRGRTSTAATGAASTTSRCCTSSSATTG